MSLKICFINYLSKIICSIISSPKLKRTSLTSSASSINGSPMLQEASFLSTIPSKKPQQTTSSSFPWLTTPLNARPKASRWWFYKRKSSSKRWQKDQYKRRLNPCPGTPKNVKNVNLHSAWICSVWTWSAFSPGISTWRQGQNGSKTTRKCPRYLKRWQSSS